MKEYEPGRRRNVPLNDSASRTVLITGFRAELDPLVKRLRSEGADAVCSR